MKRRVLLYIILVLATNLHSQEQFFEDSLLRIVNISESKEEKIEALINLSANIYIYNTQKGHQYALEAVELAKTSNNKEFLALAYGNLGNFYTTIGEYDQAIEYFLITKKLAEENGDKNLLAGITFNIGAVKSYLGDMDGALESYNNALDMRAVLMEKGDTIYSDQIQNFYINIGTIYSSRKNYNAAVEYFEKAIGASLKNNEKIPLAKAYNNLGKVYLDMGQTDKAFEYIQTGLKIRQEHNDHIGLAYSYMNLTQYYKQIGNTDSAILINNKVIELGERLEILDVALNGWLDKSVLLDTLGEYKQANLALHKYYSIKDSLFNKQVVEKITRYQLEYDFAKQESEKQKEQLRTNYRNFIFLIILAFLLISFVFLFILMKGKEKRARLEKEKLEKDLELRNKELVTNVMYLLRKNEMISDISSKLLRLKAKLKTENKESIQRIIFELHNATDETVWEEFELRFQNVHEDFYNNLSKRFPDLSKGELRLCAFLKLGMSSKEIASVSNNSSKSVEVARSRLRKKLNLTNTETDLIEFLNSI